MPSPAAEGPGEAEAFKRESEGFAFRFEEISLRPAQSIFCHAQVAAKNEFTLDFAPAGAKSSEAIENTEPSSVSLV